VVVSPLELDGLPAAVDDVSPVAAELDGAADELGGGALVVVAALSSRPQLEATSSSAVSAATDERTLR